MKMGGTTYGQGASEVAHWTVITTTWGNLMNKHLAPVALSVGLLGIVGGVAAAHAFQPTAKPAQVRLVRPAAVVVTPTVTATTAAVAPKPVARVVPKPVPVQSVKRVATVAPVQRQAVVAPADPTPAPVQTAPTTQSETAPLPAGAAPKKGNGGGPPIECGQNGCITH